MTKQSGSEPPIFNPIVDPKPSRRRKYFIPTALLSLLLLFTFSSLLRPQTVVLTPPPSPLPKSSSSVHLPSTLEIDLVEIDACPLFPVPVFDPDLNQKCCEFSPNKFYCLPQLVIAGVQKGGTTALFSRLLLHPHIHAGNKKEFHLFDFDKNYLQLKSRLQSSLVPLPRDHISLSISMESSPSYLADVKACPRMARVLSPHARFVILLRNPVERIWSEVLMKKRRISSQTQFLFQLMPAFHRQLAACNNKSLAKFRQCLPDELSSHGRISAFHKFLKANPKFPLKCLNSFDQAFQCVLNEYHDKILKETMPAIPDSLLNEMSHLQSTLSSCCTDARTCNATCFPVAAMMSDISKNFVWRSLYVFQLQHCYSVLDKERFLVLNSEDLRTRMDDTLRRVLLHAKSVNASLVNLASFSESETKSVFQERFPDFEAMTGWGHQTSSEAQDDEMPHALRVVLEDFFRPFNRQLFALLGVPPFEGWAV